MESTKAIKNYVTVSDRDVYSEDKVYRYEAIEEAIHSALTLGHKPPSHDRDDLTIHTVKLNDRCIGRSFSCECDQYLCIHIVNPDDGMLLLANSRSILAGATGIRSDYPYKDMPLDELHGVAIYKAFSRLLHHGLLTLFDENISISFSSAQPLDSRAVERIKTHNSSLHYIVKAYAEKFSVSKGEAVKIVTSERMLCTIDYGLINDRGPHCIANDIHTLNEKLKQKVKCIPGVRAKTYLDDEGFVVLDVCGEDGFISSRFFKRNPKDGLIYEYTDRECTSWCYACEFLRIDRAYCLSSDDDNGTLSVIRAERQKLNALKKRYL